MPAGINRGKNRLIPPAGINLPTMQYSYCMWPRSLNRYEEHTLLMLRLRHVRSKRPTHVGTDRLPRSLVPGTDMPRQDRAGRLITVPVQRVGRRAPWMPQQVPLVAGHGRTEVKRLHYIAAHAVKHPKHEHVCPQNVRRLVAKLGSGTHVIQYWSMYPYTETQ